MSISPDFTASQLKSHADCESAEDDGIINPLHLIEINSRILSYFPLDSRQMAACAQVCQSWYEASSEIYVALLQLEEIESISYAEIQNWQQIMLNRYGKDLSLIDLVKKCKNLKKLDLSNSDIQDSTVEKLCRITEGSLQELILNNCQLLNQLNFEGLRFLKKLSIRGCKKIVDLKLTGLKSLEEMDLSNSSELKKIQLRKLPVLKKFFAESCFDLKKLDFKDLHSLKIMDLTRCILIKDIKFQDLPSLETLRLGDCISFNQLFLSLPSLKYLDLSYCTGLTEVDLSALKALEELVLNSCVGLKEINLDNLTLLRKISVHQNESALLPALRYWSDILYTEPAISSS